MAQSGRCPLSVSDQPICWLVQLSVVAHGFSMAMQKVSNKDDEKLSPSMLEVVDSDDEAPECVSMAQAKVEALDQLEKELLAAYEDKKSRASLLTEAEQN